MKKGMVFIAALWLAGCASQKQPPAEEKVLYDIFSQKLLKNGPRVICDQPVYLKCFQISEANCLSELTPVSKECGNYAEKKWPIRSEEDVEKHAMHYFNCMIYQHFTFHRKDWHEAFACLENSKDSFDPHRSLSVFLE
ncbi:hypothetical protein [Photobacterium sp. 53610]|uniref:hypothetical protein n=1 Tax=Photobacterium sp. 53610 TaxID=3102789 RepID=UPI002ED95F20